MTDGASIIIVFLSSSLSMALIFPSCFDSIQIFVIVCVRTDPNSPFRLTVYVGQSISVYIYVL